MQQMQRIEVTFKLDLYVDPSLTEVQLKKNIEDLIYRDYPPVQTGVQCSNCDDTGYIYGGFECHCNPPKPTTSTT